MYVAKVKALMGCDLLRSYLRVCFCICNNQVFHHAALYVSQERLLAELTKKYFIATLFDLMLYLSF